MKTTNKSPVFKLDISTHTHCRNYWSAFKQQFHQRAKKLDFDAIQNLILV